MKKFHKRSRTRKPYLQILVLSILTPLILFMTRTKVKGLENLPKGGYILAPNHPSTLDPIFASLFIRRKPHFMGKSELFKGRWGSLISRLGAFPVKRGSWDKEAFETAACILERGKVLMMFVEGGVSKDPTTMNPAKPGMGHIAQLAGAYIVPVWLESTRKLYKPWTWPRINIIYGKPFKVDEAIPSRDSSQVISEEIRGKILELSP